MDELLLLSEAIQRRQIDEHIIQLRIVSAPHQEPDAARPFVEGLFAERRRIYGIEEYVEPLDTEAVEALKEELSKNSKSIRVK